MDAQEFDAKYNPLGPLTQASLASSKPHTYELGLVIAGAASGGAYEAGVLDFLLEALDRWYAAKAAGEDVPTHDVLLKTVTGTSAGGINTALLCLAAKWGFRPHRQDHAPSVWGQEADKIPSLFHQIWVDGIDISDLLTAGDIRGSHIPSILNADFLKQKLLPQALKFKGVPVEASQVPIRHWLASPLNALVTVTNLKGVPYKIAFKSGSSDEQQANYYMNLHKDFMSFTLSNAPGVPVDNTLRGAVNLDARQDPCVTANWQSLGDAALATAAFPLGLAPVVLNRDYADYQYRVSYRDPVDGTVEAVEPVPLDSNYEFVNVDGGVMNNEPFDLARKLLFGPDISDAAEQAMGEQTTRGLLLLEAFPDQLDIDSNNEVGIEQALMRIMKAQMEQAKFKREDLIFAMRDQVFTRFLLQPMRPGVDPDKIKLASAPLHAFLGFFSHSYREHDFQLGRKNCQDFLRHRLKLPQSSPVFKGDMSARVDANGLLPIIPLVGACAKEEPMPVWPAGRFQAQGDLPSQIYNRVDLIGKTLIRTHVDGKAQRWLIRRIWGGLNGRGGLRKKIVAAISQAVKSAIDTVDKAK